MSGESEIRLYYKCLLAIASYAFTVSEVQQMLYINSICCKSGGRVDACAPIKWANRDYWPHIVLALCDQMRAYSSDGFLCDHLDPRYYIIKAIHSAYKELYDKPKESPKSSHGGSYAQWACDSMKVIRMQAIKLVEEQLEKYRVLECHVAKDPQTVTAIRSFLHEVKHLGEDTAAAAASLLDLSRESEGGGGSAAGGASAASAGASAFSSVGPSKGTAGNAKRKADKPISTKRAASKKPRENPRKKRAACTKKKKKPVAKRPVVSKKSVAKKKGEE